MDIVFVQATYISLSVPTCPRSSKAARRLYVRIGVQQRKKTAMIRINMWITWMKIAMIIM